MEIPTRTWAAKEGLKTGYGMSNYWSIHEGFVYHGHNGGVEGGLTEMAYLPDYGVGYFYSINAGNGDAFEKIGKAIRAYVTRDLQKPPLPPVAPLPANASAYAGWYQLDSPRNEMTHFLDRLLGVVRVRFRDGKLLLSDLGERNQVFVPVTGAQFRDIPKKGLPDPVATVELLTPNAKGQFIQIGGGTVDHKAHPRVARVRRDYSHGVVCARRRFRPPLCAVLASWRAQQKAPPPGGAMDEIVAAHRRVELGRNCGHIYALER